MRSINLSLLAAALLAASPAVACRDPTDTTAEDIAGTTYDTVILAHVEQAAPTASPGADFHYWDATIRVDRVLLGRLSAKGKQFTIGSRHGPGSCPPVFELPKPGDLWVVYLEHDPGASEPQKRGAYPLETVRWADPKLKKLLSPRPLEKP